MFIEARNGCRQICNVCGQRRIVGGVDGEELTGDKSGSIDVARTGIERHVPKNAGIDATGQREIATCEIDLNVAITRSHIVGGNGKIIRFFNGQVIIRLTDVCSERGDRGIQGRRCVRRDIQHVGSNPIPHANDRTNRSIQPDIAGRFRIDVPCESEVARHYVNRYVAVIRENARGVNRKVICLCYGK